MSHKVKRIAITGGGGQIGYQILFRLANGDLLGPNQPIALHILELESSMEQLKGVIMELEDCAFPLLQEIVVGSDPYKVFKDIDYAFLIGAKPRGPGMERKDLLAENGKIFISQGKALDQVAASDALVLVVGNPANTNCLIALSHSKRLQPSQYYSMMQLDHNRALSMLAHKAGASVTDVKEMIVWGNHSSTQVPDFVHAKIKGSLAKDVIRDHKWLEEQFVPAVQKRGAAVIAARGKSSAGSAAHAAIGAMRHLITPSKEIFSMGVFSKGNPYGVDEGLVFSFPCRCIERGKIEIVKGYHWDDGLKEKIKASEKELLEEKALIHDLLR